MMSVAVGGLRLAKDSNHSSESRKSKQGTGSTPGCQWSVAPKKKQQYYSGNNEKSRCLCIALRYRGGRACEVITAHGCTMARCSLISRRHACGRGSRERGELFHRLVSSAAESSMADRRMLLQNKVHMYGLRCSKHFTSLPEVMPCRLASAGVPKGKKKERACRRLPTWSPTQHSVAPVPGCGPGTMRLYAGWVKCMCSRQCCRAHQGVG